MDQDKQETKEQLVPKPGPPVKEEFKTERYRFYVLFAYCLACTAAANLTMTFVSVASVVADIYGVSDAIVNSCMVFQYATTIVIAPLTAKLLEKHGFKLTFRICVITCIIGHILRYTMLLLTNNFYTIFIGQLLIGICWPFFPSSSTKLAAIWFPDNERALAGSMALLCISFGYLISCLMGPLWIVNSDSIDTEVGITHVNSYLFVQLIITVVLSIPWLLVTKEKPDNFPSMAAKMSGKQQINMKEQVKELFKNRNFVKFFVMITIVRGTRGGFSANLSTIWTQFGLSTSECSLYGGINCGVGVLGGMIFSRYVDRTKNYFITMRVLLFIAIASLFSFTFVAPAGVVQLDYLIGAIQSISTLPVTTIGQTLAVELSHPVPPNVSNGVILSVSQILSIILSYVVTLIAEKNTINVFIILSAIRLVGFFMFAFVEEDLRRLKEVDGKMKSLKDKDVAEKENDDYNKQTV